MSRSPVDYLNAFVKAKMRGLCATMLGIGPMSDTVLKASLELSVEREFPVMFIASRNQVDCKSFGGGYVRGYDQAEFVGAIESMSELVREEYGASPVYIICRDHGGPWQRDEERAQAINVKEAMDIAVKSYIADIDAGFHLLHIDPTKDPGGNAVPIEVVLNRTLELIKRLEDYRRGKNLPPVAYEVGTEETNGGHTTSKDFEEFISRLCDALESEGLPIPVFVVGQTGTLVRMTENVGSFDYETAMELSETAAEKGMLLKEHNSDYLSATDLLLHVPAGVGGSNVAPEFGSVETGAYIELCELESRLFKQYELGSEFKSGLFQAILHATLKSGRYKKWLIGDEAKLSEEKILCDTALCERIVRIGGHYTYDSPDVKDALGKLLDNLEQFGTSAREYARQAVRSSIERYITAYGIEGLTIELENYL